MLIILPLILILAESDSVSIPDVSTKHPSSHYGFNMIASMIDADGHLATGSDASLNMLNLAKKVAATDVTVFINGPTGTGKEVLSRFVHFIRRGRISHLLASIAPLFRKTC